MRKPHASNLADVPTVTEPEINSPLLPAKGSSISDDDSRIAIDAFSAAVIAMKMPGKVAAPALGISEPHLSEMRNGTRAITLPRLIGSIQRNRSFGVAFIKYLADVVGNVRVTEQRAVNKAKLRSQLVMSLESNPALFRVVMADAAEKLDVDEEVAASVWDEPTDVDGIAK